MARLQPKDELTKSSREYFLSTAINDMNVIFLTFWILKFLKNFELKQSLDFLANSLPVEWVTITIVWKNVTYFEWTRAGSCPVSNPPSLFKFYHSKMIGSMKGFQEHRGHFSGTLSCTVLGLFTDSWPITVEWSGLLHLVKQKRTSKPKKPVWSDISSTRTHQTFAQVKSKFGPSYNLFF